LTETETVINVVKAIMGAGGFALPWAFAQGGLALTSGLLAASTVISLYTLSVMLRAKKLAFEHDSKLTRDDTSSYTELASVVLGKTGGRLAELLILSCCLGVCSAYLVFVASTLQTIIGYDQNTLVIAMTPVMVLLAWLRKMSGVSVISILGTVSVTLGMIFVTWFCLQQPMMWSAVPMSAPAAFPKFFGSVAFLFFVHFTLPGIEHSMAKPEKFLKASTSAFTICAVASTIFGIVGALAFGPGVSSVVVTMLGSGSLAVIVKLLLCANLLCTFPIIVRSAFLVIEGWFNSGGIELNLFSIRAIRSAFVCFASFCSCTIPSFGALLGLVGGVSLTMITLVLPPWMLFTMTKKTGTKLSAIETIVLWACIIIGAGIVGMTLLPV